MSSTLSAERGGLRGVAVLAGSTLVPMVPTTPTLKHMLMELRSLLVSPRKPRENWRRGSAKETH